jgi:OmcA/MtrC family decaheme c-type cytochrome
MKLRKLSFAATAALALAACDGDRGPAGPAGPAGPPGPAGPGGETVGQIGQGIVFDIQSATVAEGAAPTVTFRVRDAQGVPIDLKAEASSGAFRPTFVVSKLGADGKWTSYITRTTNGRPYVEGGVTKQPVLPSATQATGQGICPGAASGTAACPQADQDRLVARGDGVYTYTFAAPITGVEAGATHRVGIYGRRTFQGVGQPGSSTFDFVPAGGTPQPRDVVTDAACNRCHTVVNAHGGARRGVKLCLTCHSPQTVDPETGNDVDMARMIHKIHKGRLLANGYTIIGNSQSVHDFSHVAMGPSHNTYFDVQGGTLGAGSDRGIIRECNLCHQGDQAAQHQTAISAATCTACHDDVNPGQTPLVQNGVTVPPNTKHGEPVSIGAFPDDACAGCHGPAPRPHPVAKVHSVNYETTRNLEFQPHTLAVKIDAVENATAGQRPAISFTVTLDGAPYDISTKPLGSLAFQLAGPITDYAAVVPTGVAAAPVRSPVPSVASALTPAASSTTTVTPAGRDGFANTTGYTTVATNTTTNVVTTTVVPASVTVIDAAAGKFKFTFPDVVTPTVDTGTAPTPTPAAAIPAGSKGVWVASFEAFYSEPQTGGDGARVSKPFAADPIFHDNPATPADDRNVRFVNVETGQDVTGSGATRTERRKIVDNAKCNNCHEDIGFHGSRSKQGVDYCATCHDPNLDNSGRGRFPVSAGTGGNVFLAQSVSTNVFIHKIHMGAELTQQPYQLGTNRTAGSAGPGGEGLADFSQFEAPSPMGNCQTCHEGQTFALPVSPNLLPVKRTPMTCGAPGAAGGATDNETVGGVEWCGNRIAAAPIYMPPQKAVCTSCHDTPAAAAHADLNTIYPTGQTAASYNPYPALPTNPQQPDPAKTAIETCATCHGAGRDFDAVTVHPPVLAPTVDLPDSP